MLQQIIAILVIIFFIARLFWQKQSKLISANEFIFWLIFWLLAAASIMSLRLIDQLVASIGFSGSGIEVLLYIAIAILFYLIFRLRLKLEKVERDLTKIVSHIAIKKNNQ
jgi:hypothetical protein